MPVDPLTVGLIVSTLFGGVSNALTGNSQKKSNEKLSREQLASQEKQAELDRQAREKLGLQSTALAESSHDPYRHHMSQANALGKLDMIERGSYSPTKLTPAAPYASYVPQMSGGFSYSKSPELGQYAGTLKKAVASGRTAPTMTDPKNYGKTGAINLVQAALNGGALPADPNAPAPAPDPIADALRRLDEIRRRRGTRWSDGGKPSELESEIANYLAPPRGAF